MLGKCKFFSCLLLILLSAQAQSNNSCAVHFGDKVKKDESSFSYDLSMSTDTTWAKDFEQYQICKEFCESAEMFNAKKVDRGCEIYGEYIEESKYKRIHDETLSNLCVIYMAHDADFLYRHNPFSVAPTTSLFGYSRAITDSKQACIDSVGKNYGCNMDGSAGCMAFYGEESVSTKAVVYAGLWLYKYYIIALLLALFGLYRGASLLLSKARS